MKFTLHFALHDMASTLAMAILAPFLCSQKWLTYFTSMCGSFRLAPIRIKVMAITKTTRSLHDLTHALDNHNYGLPYNTRDHLHANEELNLMNRVDCKLDIRMPLLNRLCYYSLHRFLG